jgi:hypothetical protein
MQMLRQLIAPENLQEEWIVELVVRAVAVVAVEGPMILNPA